MQGYIFYGLDPYYIKYLPLEVSPLLFLFLSTLLWCSKLKEWCQFLAMQPFVQFHGNWFHTVAIIAVFYIVCLALTQGFFLCVAAILYPHTHKFSETKRLTSKGMISIKKGKRKFFWILKFFWIFLFCRLFVLILVLILLISKKYRPMGLGSVLARDAPRSQRLSWVEWVSWVCWVYRWVKWVRANIFFVCKQSQRIFRKSSNQEETFKFLKTEVCLKTTESIRSKQYSTCFFKTSWIP